LDEAAAAESVEQSEEGDLPNEQGEEEEPAEPVALDEAAAAESVEQSEEGDLPNEQGEEEEPAEPVAPSEAAAAKAVALDIPIDRVQIRFEDREAIQNYCKEAINSMETKYGRSTKYGLDIQSLVDNRKYSLSSIAQQADSAGLSPTQTGTLVHRIAELRGLQDHTQEVIDGVRLLEQPIYTEEGRRVELDHVIIRGDTHYILDYKPINIADIINEQPWGQEYKAWIDQKHDGDYTKIKNLSTRDMPDELRKNLCEFLRNEMTRYKKQTENYQQIYRQQKGLGDNIKVKTAIHPYFVYRPRQMSSDINL